MHLVHAFGSLGAIIMAMPAHAIIMRVIDHAPAKSSFHSRSQKWVGARPYGRSPNNKITNQAQNLLSAIIISHWHYFRHFANC